MGLLMAAGWGVENPRLRLHPRQCATGWMPGASLRSCGRSWAGGGCTGSTGTYSSRSMASSCPPRRGRRVAGRLVVPRRRMCGCAPLAAGTSGTGVGCSCGAAWSAAGGRGEPEGLAPLAAGPVSGASARARCLDGGGASVVLPALRWAAAWGGVPTDCDRDPAPSTTGRRPGVLARASWRRGGCNAAVAAAVPQLDAAGPGALACAAESSAPGPVLALACVARSPPGLARVSESLP